MSGMSARARLARARHRLPVEREGLPVGGPERLQLLDGGGGTAAGRLEIEPGLEGDVHDPSAQAHLRLRELLGRQRPERAVGVAPADRRADDRHPRPACLVHDPVGVAAPEQFPEDDEDVARPPAGAGREVAERGVGHVASGSGGRR
jgi:hypothetical protein